MLQQQPVFIDGKKYIWDGHIFSDKNKAKTHARRYLRQGFKIHMENDNGNYFLFLWRSWPFEPARSLPGPQEDNIIEKRYIQDRRTNGNDTKTD